MFSIDDKVVYPGYGVARVAQIITKTVGDQSASFYELVFLNKDMMVLVPIEGACAVGLRPLSSHKTIQDVFSSLAEPARRLSNAEFSASNWNRRNKEYQTKLKAGDLRELSNMYRELYCIAVQKELSFGEKSLLSQIEALLVEEISLVEELNQEKTMEQLRTLCSTVAHERASSSETTV